MIKPDAPFEKRNPQITLNGKIPNKNTTVPRRSYKMKGHLTLYSESVSYNYIKPKL